MLEWELPIPLKIWTKVYTINRRYCDSMAIRSEFRTETSEKTKNQTSAGMANL